ncbi:MAG TPA: alpha-ketoglutarate-dependent dioxygenase AlkB [Flavisolibacter sp.]|jgi:alkylated DNA repair dioxygenase AlkB|nr:alpha-ketoglutarate-dependent dioxygenase AlkB [Flavisolibacter sp.]
MQTLFSLEPAFPAGFQYIEDFLSKVEEDALLQFAKTTALHSFRFQGYEANRRVASFGWDWSFESRELSKGKDIPPVFDGLIKRVVQLLSFPPDAFAELLVTEYPVGSVINWHHDAPPFALIAGVSLQADCMFKLRPFAKEAQTRKATISFPVKRRSLYIMQGEAREEWQHSTAPVREVRYSITLRTLKWKPANAG